jgi:RimJ/RimL family protein N-acetyltransferase
MFCQPPGHGRQSSPNPYPAIFLEYAERMSLPTPTLKTPRLRLRPFVESDTDAIFALQSNSRVLRYWDSPPWKERAQAERFIKRCRQIEQEGTGARLVIELDADRNSSAGAISPTGTRPTAAQKRLLPR